MQKKLTFKEHIALQENISDFALKIAADWLKTDPKKLKPVDQSTEEKVLMQGKELKNKYVKMANGALVVRLFQALSNKLFARIESPDGDKKTYTTAAA